MGTQQILLVVMSVIIVGIMIMVGITMFNAQAYSSNKRALASEMLTYPPYVFKYWETSKLLAGAGKEEANVTIPRVASYIGFTDTLYSLTSENGEFRVILATGQSVGLRGIGNATKNGKHPMITTRINLLTKKYTISSGEIEGW